MLQFSPPPPPPPIFALIVSHDEYWNCIIYINYYICLTSPFAVFSQTGFVYDDKLARHYCAWNSKYTERPERIKECYSRMQQLGLVSRCVNIPVSGFKGELSWKALHYRPPWYLRTDNQTAVFHSVSCPLRKKQRKINVWK